MRSANVKTISIISYIALLLMKAPRVFFLLYQREGAIGRARRDGTIAFHCGISGALLVHFLRRFDPR